ncbi:hypothetical protein H6G64_31935 [Calothrix sp. FACHB-156]|nr:hypothetical protein [Calothrix sp. FACHB-156]
MLHHLAISVTNPSLVAKVLAELMNGQFFVFPLCPGAYVAIAGDAYGTAIEVLPQNSVWVPGFIEAEIKSAAQMPKYAPVHAALSVPVSRETVEVIGQREGWLVRYCDRGPFQLMELWIENTLMVELITQEMATNYLTFMQPAAYANFLNSISQ